MKLVELYLPVSLLDEIEEIAIWANCHSRNAFIHYAIRCFIRLWYQDGVVNACGNDIPALPSKKTMLAMPEMIIDTIDTIVGEDAYRDRSALVIEMLRRSIEEWHTTGETQVPGKR